MATLCAVALLTGFGSWIAHSPAPSWWSPDRGLGIAAQLAVGFALVPVWLKLGFARE